MERFKDNVLIINLGWEQLQLYKFVKIFFKNIHIIDFKKKNILNNKEIKSRIVIKHTETKKALAYAKGKKIKYIFSDQCDYALYLQSFLNKELNLNGHSFKAGLLSNDKSKLYNFCKKKKILIPNFLILNNQPNIKRIKQFLLKNNKAISKPIDNRGSIGVNTSDKKNYKESIQNSLKNSIKKKIIFQKYIKGKNIIVESTGSRIDLIGEKKMSKINIYLNSDILFSKPNLNKKFHKKIISTHKNIINKTKFKTGFVSAEYIYYRNKIWLIEFTNRGGGVGISSIIKSKILGYNSYIDLLSEIFKKKNININQLKKIFKTNKKKFIYLKYVLFEKNYSTNKLTYYKNCFSNDKIDLFYIWNLKAKKLCQIKDASNRNGVIISSANSISKSKKKVNDFLKKELNIY